MSELGFKTPGMINPKGKARVYFSCHPGDFATYFERISEEILSFQDCAIWYPKDPHAKRSATYLEDLADMQLFVLPVTKALLTEDGPILKQELPFAMEHRIPILPLIQEANLEGLYTEKMGNLQFLDPFSNAEAALRYEEKLEKFLSSVLGTSHLTQQIRASFDSHAFLSYRKKDRKLARELMERIHQNDFCRDLSIWYDEYLTPGEDWSETIQTALNNSDLFVLAVTPNLICEPNYVQAHEYPMAAELNKPILPVEMASTDLAQLRQQYSGIPNSVPGQNRDELACLLRQAMDKLPRHHINNDPEHLYLIGMAYLNGIDVETDHHRAAQLIIEAAEAGVTEAAATLVSMYGKGHGVAWDTEKMLYWQQKLLQLRQRDYDAKPQLSTGLLLLEELRAMADWREQQNDPEGQLNFLHRMTQVAAPLYESTSDPNACRHLAAVYALLADQHRDADAYDQAMAYYEKSEGLILKQLQAANIRISPDPQPEDRAAIQLPDDDTPAILMILLSDFCSTLCNKADLLLRMADETEQPALQARAAVLYRRVYTYLCSDAMQYGWLGTMEQISTICGRLGDIAQREGKSSEAKHWLITAMAMDDLRYTKAKTGNDPFAAEAYGRSCLQLAMQDPNNPDLFYLHKAIELFKEMAHKAPELTMFRDYVQELEPYLEALKEREIQKYNELPAPKRTPEGYMELDTRPPKPFSGPYMHSHRARHEKHCKAIHQEIENRKNAALQRLEQKHLARLPKKEAVPAPEKAQPKAPRVTMETPANTISEAEREKQYYANKHRLEDPTTREQALGNLKQLAEQGYGPAARYLGECYQEGNFVSQDIGHAIGYYEAAAQQQDMHAIQALVYIYEKQENIKKAAAWCQFAEKQFPDEEWFVAPLQKVVTEMRNNRQERELFEQARKLFEDAAVANKAKAYQLLLECCKLYGRGVKYVEYYIGLCCELGIGTKTDPREAFLRYSDARYHGNLWAAYRLGHCKKLGIGCSQDKKAAARYYLESPASLGERGYQQLAKLNIFYYLQAKKAHEKAYLQEAPKRAEKQHWAIPYLDALEEAQDP